MWHGYAPFPGRNYPYPAGRPPAPFFLPVSDRPMTPEEFARHQEVARQQEHLRRRSSGLTDELRPRKSAHRTQSVDSKFSQASLKVSDGEAPVISLRTDDTTPPQEARTPQISADQQFLEAPRSDLSLEARSLKLSPAGVSGSHQLVVGDAQPISSKSEQPADSAGLEDFTSGLAAFESNQAVHSPASSLSSLPSWGLMDSSADHEEQDQDVKADEVSSRPDHAEDAHDQQAWPDMEVAHAREPQLSSLYGGSSWQKRRRDYMGPSKPEPVEPPVTASSVQITVAERDQQSDVQPSDAPAMQQQQQTGMGHQVLLEYHEKEEELPCPEVPDSEEVAAASWRRAATPVSKSGKEKIIAHASTQAYPILLIVGSSSCTCSSLQGHVSKSLLCKMGHAATFASCGYRQSLQIPGETNWIHGSARLALVQPLESLAMGPGIA